MSPLERECRITGKRFLLSASEQELLRKMELPPPTLCIEERHRRRLAYRNERNIYRRTCDFSGKPIISVYSPDKPYTVYAPDIWWSDAWDAERYGREMDFSRPFFEQFNELKTSVPRLALINVQGENSDYCHHTLGNKNCYLVFGGDYNQDCSYGIFNMHCKDCHDVYWVNKSELCYEAIDCHACYDVKYSQNSHNCRNSSFLFECRNCSDCLFCVGLRGKQFYIHNEAHTPEAYAEKIASLRLDSWSAVTELKVQFATYKLEFPHRFAHIVQSEDVSGDRISNAKNCVNCFDIEGPAQDLKDCIFSGWDGSSDLVSCNNVGIRTELYYECSYCNTGSNGAFCIYGWGSSDIMYCDTVMNSNNLFACASMKKAEYCILNTKYSRSDYNTLRSKIISHMKQTGEWGEFFPAQHAFWGYNETAAQDYFPLSAAEARALGYPWHDEVQAAPATGMSFPDSIFSANSDICTGTAVCERTGRTYRITPQEFAFYQKQGIPLPRFAPETRNQLRLKMRNGIQSWNRQCACCNADICTSYSPSSAATVYCEDCYLRAAYD